MEVSSTNWSAKVPNELLLNIFNYFAKDREQLIRIAAVCKKWQAVIAQYKFSYHENCLHLNISQKLWCEKIVCFEGDKQSIRELIIDKRKSIYVLFTNGALYHLSRQGTFKLHHRFDKDVTSTVVEASLGGKFEYSTSHVVRVAANSYLGGWVQQGRDGGSYSSSYCENHLQVLDTLGKVSQQIFLNIDKTCVQIDSIRRVEKFGEYILTCGMHGYFVGNSFFDFISPNVVWQLKEKESVYVDLQQCLEPVLQLSLSDKAILIDGLFIDIISPNKIKMINFVRNPLINKRNSYCAIV